MTVFSGKSVYLAKKVADEVLGGTDFTPPATVYLALFSVAPTNGSGTVAGTEATGAGYARKSLTNDATIWTAASGTTTPVTKVNAGIISMATASGDWSSGATMKAWGIFDASTAGNLLFYGPITTPTAVASGDTPTFAAGAISLTLQ